MPNTENQTEGQPQVGTTDLLACPFCGSKAKTSIMNTHAIRVGCTKCPAQMLFVPTAFAVDCEKRWNLRSQANKELSGGA